MGVTQHTDDYGIKIPLEIREQISLKPGDLVEFRIEDGSIIIASLSTSYSDYMRGLHAEIWESVDPDEYVRQERDSWEKDTDGPLTLT